MEEENNILDYLDPNILVEKLTSKINQAAVSTNLEPIRNISAGATGIINLPIAIKNRVNSAITRVLPWWTGEKVKDPRNTWTIDKRNHLARYYDKNGKLVITSPAGTGLVQGNKSKSGDNKTPNGTYILGGSENTSNKKGGWWSFGSHFYRTSHNDGKSGVGLHGTGNPLFNGMNISHGCIRIDDSAIKKFHDIAPNNGKGTKIVIYERKGGQLPVVLRFKRKYRKNK